MRAFTIIALLVLAGGMLPGLTAAQRDTETRRDVYAIYSSLISAADELLLIEATTLTEKVGYGTPFRPQSDSLLSCILPPAEDAASFGEARADYDVRKDVPVALEREFTLNRPYQLLSREEALTFLQDSLRSTPQIMPPGGIPPNPNPLFPRAKRVFRLSDVYFNKDRSLAFTYVSVMTTTMDGQGGWKILKRAKGAWQEVPYGNPSSGSPIWRACVSGSMR
jgi:hypothetical protein